MIAVDDDDDDDDDTDGNTTDLVVSGVYGRTDDDVDDNDDDRNDENVDDIVVVVVGGVVVVFVVVVGSVAAATVDDDDDDDTVVSVEEGITKELGEDDKDEKLYASVSVGEGGRGDGVDDNNRLQVAQQVMSPFGLEQSSIVHSVALSPYSHPTTSTYPKQRQ